MARKPSLRSIELLGQENVRKAFARLEVAALRRVQEQVKVSAEKIEAGAKARIRVDSGATKEGIRTIIRDFGMTATIGSGDPNARSEEFGNVNKSASPFLNPAFQEERRHYVKGVEDALNNAGRDASDKGAA